MSEEITQVNHHIEDLRRRLLKIFITVGIITIFVMTFHATAVDVFDTTVYYPYPQPLDNIAAQITDYMRDNLVPENVQLIQTAPGQAFFSQVYIAALVGIVASMPIIVSQLANFLKPALNEREIHVSRSITIPTIGLFITGCVFAYLIVIPFVLDFLYKYGESAELITFLNIIDFVTFVLQFLIAFGLSFQLPLIMYALSQSGMIDASYWRKNIRYAIVILVIFGAVVTPDGSGVTMWFIAGPMMALYLAGMVIVERKEKEIMKT